MLRFFPANSAHGSLFFEMELGLDFGDVRGRYGVFIPCGAVYYFQTEALPEIDSDTR
jgi:hypothetical protein